MYISLTDAVRSVIDDLPDRDYHKLWDKLEEIAAMEPAEVTQDPRHQYVSSKRMFGTKIPGTELTVFWSVVDADLVVAALGWDSQI